MVRVVLKAESVDLEGRASHTLAHAVEQECMRRAGKCFNSRSPESLLDVGPCVQERVSFWIDEHARYLCVAAMINEGAELLLLDSPSALLM